MHVQRIRVCFVQLKPLTQCATVIVLDAAVDLRDAIIAAAQLLFQIGKCMPERAEEDDLVVFQLLLFVDHRADAIELWVVFRQQICELQHMMSQRHQCGRGFSVQIVLIHVYIRVFNHLVKAPCDQIPDVGREPEDAACRLTSNRAHHEGNAAHIVELGKRFVFKSQQFVMQVVLLRGEAGFDRVRPADAEILNILSACPVQHGVEAVERFHIGNEFDAFFACKAALSRILISLTLSLVFILPKAIASLQSRQVTLSSLQQRSDRWDRYIRR